MTESVGHGAFPPQTWLHLLSQHEPISQCCSHWEASTAPPKQGTELGQPLGVWMNQGLVSRKKAQSTEPAPNGKKTPKLLYFW